VSDTLPFAGNDLPAHYPSFGFGYGILANQAGYHDLEHALTRMEDFYRQQGFTIHRHRRVGLDRLQFWSLALRLNRHIDIVAEVGRVSEKQGYLHTSDTMALIHWTPRPGNSPGLFAGLGGGEYAFSWKQEYHDPVSPVGSGGWYELESIRFSWHGVYASAVAGVALRPSTNTLIEIYGQHLMMKTVRVQSLNVGRLSIDLSGSLLGARLRLYY
jgi:hypothetical protein